ncbi:MAG: WD40 repeat domain-containing protein [Anaerolineales bacterium]|nr:WD40 repeat domain-containing protein [Anaerolineales bacterium]
MKQNKWFLLIVASVVGSLLLGACSISVELLSTPTASATAVASIPATDTPVPVASSVPATPTLTPTFIPIQSDTAQMLKNFMSVTEDEDVRSVAFSPDGTVLAAAGGNANDFNVHVWDVATGQLVGVLNGHTDIVWGLAFSPDGKLLASISRDHKAIIRDWRNGDILKILDFPGEVTSVSFSPDGQTLAVGGVNKPSEQGHTAAIWTYSVSTWELSVKFLEYINITAMAYSPNGDILIGGGTSRNIQVWSVSDGASLFTLSHTHQVLKAVISPDGSTLATGTCTKVVNSVCADGGIWLWDLPTGKLIKKLNGFPDFVENLAFSADSSLLIAGSRDGTLHVYETSNYGSIFETKSPDGINAMSLSSDDKVLAIGTYNGDIHFWRIEPRP